MLLTLNQDFQGFTPNDFISLSSTEGTPEVEYYRATRQPEADGEPAASCILIASRDKAAIKASAAFIYDRKLMPAFSDWKDVGVIMSTGPDVSFVAVELPVNTVSLAGILAAERMTFAEILPLFHDIISSYFAVYGREMFTRSFAPEDIMILTAVVDGKTVRRPLPVAAPPVRRPVEGLPMSRLLSTPPELTGGEFFTGTTDERSWMFQAGLLLTEMLQNRLPWDFSSIPPEATPEQFIAERGKLMNTRPNLDFISGLRRVVLSCIAADPQLRPSSAQAFIKDIEQLAETYGTRGLKPVILNPEQDRAPESDDGENTVSPSPQKPVMTDVENDDSDDTLTDRQSGGSREPRLRLSFRQGKGGGFSDVAGLDDIKATMTRNFISIVKNPDVAKTFRIEPPNGMLLWGPPGNGKSFLSQKLAEESGLYYTTVNPGDLSSIYIHGTQGLISEMFNKCERMAARKKSGVLLLLEEFDALVPNRGTTDGDSNSRNDEVAEFLTRLNNCASKGVYVIATTNRIDAIDPAVMRKGRMDEVIYVDLPDEEVRRKLIDLELRDRPHDDVDMARLVKLTAGFSSGDIAYLVKESARKAFELTIAAPDKNVANITQESLEATISNSHPSVTEAERRKYEKLRDSYARHRRQAPKVGF